MNRADATWSHANATTAADNILGEVDAGNALTLAAINIQLDAAVTDTELTGAGGSLSFGAVLDILEIVAGRGYDLPSGSQILDSAVLPIPVFDQTQRGSFTHPVVVQDTNFDDGEWHPTSIGGDTVQYENKPIRDTLHSQSLAISLATGSLSRLADTVNTLFPDSDQLPWYPTTYQKGPNNAQVDNVRLVTVYDDDGAVLA